ncbi:MAG: hypothetical protein VX910_12400 [Candidatus Latescibacterota bacterium]|nr:hypothetical protein [Candidatus Latescibacterota bacterium]
MKRWIRFTSSITAFLILWTTLLGSGLTFAQEEKDEKDQLLVVRTIVGRDTNGWEVVDVRNNSGNVVILSPVVGRDIDLDESIKFSMFQGPSEFNRRAEIPVLGTPVPGFQKAIFLKRSNGKFGIRIEYTTVRKTNFRTIRLKEVDVQRIREYVENWDQIQNGDYKIHNRDTAIEEGAEYPKVTDESVSFETRRTRFVLARRMDGSLTLKDGKEINGEFVPAFDEGSILIESGFTSHSIPVENIQRIRTVGNKSSSAMKGAVGTALGSAVSGALTGALAAWQSNANVKEWTIFGTVFFGSAGFLTGLLRGASGGRSSEDIILGPVGDLADEGM